MTTAKQVKESDYTKQSGGRYKTTLDNNNSIFGLICGIFAPFAAVVFDFIPAGVSAGNDTITEVEHGLLEDDVVQFTTTVTLPAGLSLATNYHVIDTGLTADVFSVSASQGGAVIDITDTGSGIHTATLTLGLTMRLSKGLIVVSDAIPTAVALQKITAVSAPSANPRKDLVTINKTTGALTVTTGAENASPVDPTVPAGKIPVARINMVVSQTEIVNADIDDLRAVTLGTTESLDSLKTNMALNFFLDAIDHARSIQNLQDGWIDQFEDQTGIDDPNSTGESYDASNDLYAPVAASTSKITNVTAIGDFNSLAIPFDGTTTGTKAGAGTFKSGSAGGPAYAGQDWGSGVTKLAVQARVYPASDEGFLSTSFNAADLVTIVFEGSNTGAFAGEEDTLATSASFANRLSTAETLVYAGSTEYRYHRISLSNDQSVNPLLVEVEFYEDIAAENIMLIAEPVVALSVPASAHVTLFKEDIDAITLNTDLFAWASRSKQSFTGTNATNVLNATAHGLADTDRVILVSSGADLPLDLVSSIVYFVISSNADDFQVSLTSGGAAVTFSDDGTGTHQVHAVTAVTLVDEGTYSSYDIISGTADISGQPSDTDMGLFVQTANVKQMKFHGQSLQWS